MNSVFDEVAADRSIHFDEIEDSCSEKDYLEND